jgi:hypothetical protein
MNSGDLPPKKVKKVSFAGVAEEVYQFARKSTFSRHPRRRISTNFSRCMVLEVTRVDITGYKVPEDTGSESDSGECARTIPVEEVISCSRTNPVKLKRNSITSSKPTQERTVASEVTASRRLKRNHLLELDVDSNDDSPGEQLTPKRPCKRSKQKLELANTAPQSVENSSECVRSSEEIEYALKLNETIEKITGAAEVEKRYSIVLCIIMGITVGLCRLVDSLPVTTPPSQPCSLNVRTTNVTQSKSVQADSGFIVDREVCA